ncbi:MAG: hypothetical protein ACREEM_49635 [Blastocatellia bacterium]
MKEQGNSTAAAGAAPEAQGTLVSIFVPYDHPLLQLNRVLNWDGLKEVMVKYWREAGKNVAGGPGRPWPVSLYVPLLVLMRIRNLNDRGMERHLAYDAAARAFIGWTSDSTPWVRDHSNIARAVRALGVEGWREVDELIVQQAVKLGFATTEVLSSDTTVQEPQIGYPNEPGILRGVAQRVYRSLKKMGRRGVEGVESGIEQAKEIFKQVKHHHLFAKGAQQKQEILKSLVEKTRELMEDCHQVVERVGQSADRVVQSGVEKLKQLEVFCATLLRQIAHWLQTGTVASGKYLHAGVTGARAIVKNKTGKKVEFGFKWLIHRIGGGYIFGKRVEATADENNMPIEAIKDYRQVFGAEATPQMSVYDRGGSAKTTVEELQKIGVEKVGLVPKGKTPWSVAEEDRKEVLSQRGQTEGSIGTLKRYGFGGRRERSNETIEAAGQRALVSVNLAKLTRDLVNREKQAQMIAV